jgi:hypothetical protein
MMPWEDGTLCTGETRAGRPCCNYAVAGLGHVKRCMHHMGELLLPEAEAITGIRRCRHPSGCRQFAVVGTDPPRCKVHGANRGSVLYKRAIMRVAQERYAELYAEFLAGRHG